MKYNIYSKSGISSLMKDSGIAPNKQLGQNFLIDRNKIEQIAEGANIDGKNVLEIGPGLGALTLALEERAKRVVAVEIDRGFLEPLQLVLSKDEDGSISRPSIISSPYDVDGSNNIFHKSNTTIVHADFLKLNLDIIGKLFESNSFSVCANLPYYITTPIIMRLIESDYNIDRMVFLMQKEVADRMAAKPGTKNYGSLSIAIEYYLNVEKITEVPPNCFVPEPKVNSLVLALTKKSAPPVVINDTKQLFRLIRSGFAMRRKTLYNNLIAAYSNMPKDQIASAIRDCDLDDRVRAESLSLEKFAELYNQLF